MQNGGQALALVMGATPAAPLAPFVAFFANVLGGWINDNARAKVAQRYLTDTVTIALQQAYYEGYTARYNQGIGLYNAGLYDRAQSEFDAARAAGEANRLKVARHIDAVEAAAYRAWMAKVAGASDAKLDAHLWDGWLMGDAQIRGFPYTSEFNRGSPGGWQQYTRAGGVVVWAARPDHPDYNGRAVEPMTPEAAARMEEVRRERERRAMVVEASGRSPGSYISTVKDDMRTGTREAGDWDFSDDYDPEPPPPRAPPAPPPPPPPPPTPAPPPAPPPPPPPPTQTPAPRPTPRPAIPPDVPYDPSDKRRREIE